MNIQPATSPIGDVLIYEYGARLDKESLPAALEQISQARRLYNNLVACIRRIVEEQRAFVIDRAGPEAADVDAEITRLSEQFDTAKGNDDEPAMKVIAQERRLKWRDLAALVKVARQANKAEIKDRFFSRIGRNSSCDTYKIRCQAVAEGLGWATANAVLDSALQAFKRSFERGQAPRFAVGAETEQDSLTLQFTAAGGVESADFLAGRHGELAIHPTNGCGRRKYGEFRFRLGAAKAGIDATGTWQYHRPLREGTRIGLARLVRRRVGKDYKWALQLMVRLPEPLSLPVGRRKPLVAVHFGWAADVSGRRVAGVADGADPGAANVIQLPPDIEDDLGRAAQIASDRDNSRDALVADWLKAFDPAGAPDAVRDELAALKRLPAQHVALMRLHRLCRLWMQEGELPDVLSAWRKTDRLAWQAGAHIARRARLRRRDYYRNLAADLARGYDAVAIEPLDLAEAAKKVDEATGEKSEFGRKARSGRVVAALYELESALRWAAVKHGAAVIDLIGETASCCSVCGSGAISSDAEDRQTLHCPDCGAVLCRKKNGAAVAWQMVSDQREDVVAAYWLAQSEDRRRAQAERAEKLKKMADGRRAARTRSDGEMSGGSRSVDAGA